MTAKRIDEAATEEISDFLGDAFDPIDGGLAARKRADMTGYARLAQFLSSPTEFAQSALGLAGVMGTMFRRIRNDEKFMVDFLRLLGFFAHCFGFSRQVYTLSGQLKPEAFARVVSEKMLFRDNYTRNHGEFSHTLQWLVMAYRFEGEWPVAELYANSVRYNSDRSTKNKEFIFAKEEGGKVKSRPAEVWNFLVDCFEGEEDFRTNILCKTFRCPQIVTNKLRAILPSENWLGEFLYHRRHLGLTKGDAPPPGGHYDRQRQITWTKDFQKRMLATYYDEVDKGIFALKDGSLR